MEEFFNQLKERYLALSEEEKDVIRSLMGTEQGRVLLKILGPEIASQINLRRPAQPAPQRRGLGMR
jgi:hypothetical protein|tara:strand:- start:342 stop:539 length:198 start_codon:yes stop_codon:yes gene_type:complete